MKHTGSCLLVLLAGCTAANPALFPPRTIDPSADIVVFSNHWHTGVIVRTADLPAEVRAGLKDFAAFPYVAIGWGDTDFYRASKINAWMTVRALFFSRGVVLLVIGLSNEPEQAFEPSVDVYRVHASRAGYEKMIAEIGASFDRATGTMIDGGQGAEGVSHFYGGVGRYGAFDTCNVWTAKMLRTAGLPISPTFALTADNVEYQIGRIPGALKNGRPFPRMRRGIVPIRQGSRLILSPSTPAED